MNTVYLFAVLSFIIAVLFGWLINSLIYLLIKYFSPGPKRLKPTLRARAAYAFFTGTLIFIFWVVVVLRNVEMH